MTSDQRLPRFALVGAAGFLVDAAFLTFLMKGWGLDHYSARAVSFTAAVTATWYLTRRWVFHRSREQMNHREYGSYFAVQLIGAAINLLVFALTIEFVAGLQDVPVVPLAIGAALALIFNFSASRRFVFADCEDPEPQSSEPSR